MSKFIGGPADGKDATKYYRHDCQEVWIKTRPKITLARFLEESDIVEQAITVVETLYELHPDGNYYCGKPAE